MRFYRALLRLYPWAFRAEYRDELARAFAERTRGRAGLGGALATAADAIADVVPNALAAHFEILRQDLVYAARSLRRTPGFAIAAILVVALGVGANTAVFSIADLVFLRPLPYAESDRLVKLWEATPDGSSTNNVSPANYRDWRASTTSFSGMAAYTLRPANLVGVGEPRRLELARVTAELMPVMGVAPAIGRRFEAVDVATGPCVVLSDGLWHSHFGGDPRVIGTTVRLDDVAHTVVGVMPPSFQFPDRSVEAWTSLAFRDQDFEDRTDTFLEVVARLKPGVTAARARQELELVSTRLEQQYPQANRDVRVAVVGLREDFAQRARLMVTALCGAALCILLLACANLASLFLARGAYRVRELAVRAALGAGRDRLMRQLVTESLGVATIGGLLGVAIAVAGVPLLVRLVPTRLPIEGNPSLDLRVLAVAGALMLITGIAFGLAPALQAGRSNGIDALRSGARTTGGRTQRLRAGLVIVEVAASVILLVGSGLLIRAVWNLHAIDPGFRAEHVLALRTALPLPRYDFTERRAQYYERVLAEVRGLPSVRHAAYATGLPMSMRAGIWGAAPTRDADHADRELVSLRFVTPQYFAALGIPLRRGRDVAATDTREQPHVAVVSEGFAHELWPNQDPLGKRFFVVDQERTVVGVVGEVKVRGLEIASEPQVYLPYRQVRDSSLIAYMPKEMVVHTDGAPSPHLLPRIREIVAAADRDLPVSHVRTMTDIVTEETASRVTQIRLLGALAAIALLIAGIGIHGLLAFAVAQRSREMGVRMALGARPEGIVGLVMREGLVLAGAGIAIGVLLAYAGARAMSALLFGVRPEDPLTVAIAVGLCLATVLAGGLRPALAAARVDPLTALRAE
jgi:predicted permease